MTKLEWKRFWRFWLKHPFSYIKYECPPDAGYVVWVVSLFGKYKEDITDINNELDNF